MVLSSVTGDGRKLSVSFLNGLFCANALTEASPQFKRCEFVCSINKVLEHRFSNLFFRNNGDLEVVSVVLSGPAVVLALNGLLSRKII